MTATCIENVAISAAAKKKGYKKWNEQIKNITEGALNDSSDVLTTVEVVRTQSCYWLFQDYNPSKILPLADFLKKGSTITGQNASATFLTASQLKALVSKLAHACANVYASRKSPFGNLDANSVFVIDFLGGGGLGPEIKLDLSQGD